MDHPQPSTGPGAFLHRIIKAVLATAAIVILFLLIWQGITVLLLLFTGVLLAIFLNTLANWLADHTSLSYRWSVVAVVIILVAAAGLSGLLLAPNLSSQAQELVTTLPESARAAVDKYTPFSWGAIQEQLPPLNEIALSSRSNLLPSLSGIVSTTVNFVAYFIIILFVGFYLAIDPSLYIDGAVKLAPLDKRPRLREVLEKVGYTLRWWLVGRLISMTAIAVLSVIGLMIIGVPLAFILGVLSGLLAFVPYIGPIAALVPPLLIALTESTSQALYVFLLYGGIQFVESYLLTPLVQKRTVSLPPVVLLLSQVLMGLLLGVFGLVVANPLTAATLVAVRMLYVEDFLGDPDVEPLAE